MGREIKRVPMRFDWPLSKVWKGFLCALPSPRKCPACEGSGSSKAYKLLTAVWYGHRHDDVLPMLANGKFPPALTAFVLGELVFSKQQPLQGRAWVAGWNHHIDQKDVDALVKADRLWDFTRRPLSPVQKCHPNGWTVEPNGHHPTAEEVNKWSYAQFGHDSLNQWICAKARCKRYRVAAECQTCKGTGYQKSPKDQAKRRAIRQWKAQEPPTGDGWQLWETVSEGSPISPVFATPERLARWLSSPAAGREQRNYDTALKWITGSGWAMSMMSVGGVLVDPMDSVTPMTP